MCGDSEYFRDSGTACLVLYLSVRRKIVETYLTWKYGGLQLHYARINCRSCCLYKPQLNQQIYFNITFNTMGRHSFQKDAILCMCPPTHPYQVVPHGRNNGSKYYQSAINCRTISRNDDLPRISGGRKSGGYSESLSGSTILYTASPVQPSQVGGVIVYTASTVR